MQTLVIATRNLHKVQEIRSILGDGFAYKTFLDFSDADAPAESADSFGGNAMIKAVELAVWLVERGVRFPSEYSVLADDSGLEVKSLAWAPGVHSARFAALDDDREGNSKDSENNAKLMRLLAAQPSATRRARFRCVLALTPGASLEVTDRGDSLRGLLAQHTQFFEGTCEGRIGHHESGAGGFGYDPLFIPDGHERSFAELGESIKNTISHRARALMELRRALLKNAG